MMLHLPRSLSFFAALVRTGRFPPETWAAFALGSKVLGPDLASFNFLATLSSCPGR